MTDARVVDASVFVDLATLRRGWQAVAERLVGVAMHAPAHVDVEVMSALARLSRAGTLTDDQAKAALGRFREAPITRHELPGLVLGAWARIDRLRVTDALYVELAASLGTRMLTTDGRLARVSELAELID